MRKQQSRDVLKAPGFGAHASKPAPGVRRRNALCTPEPGTEKAPGFAAHASKPAPGVRRRTALCALAVCLVLALLLPSCTLLQDPDAQPYSAALLEETLTAAARTGETQAVLTLVPGEGLDTRVRADVNRLLEETYCLARFVSELEWTVAGTWRAQELAFTISYHEDAPQWEAVIGADGAPKTVPFSEDAVREWMLGEIASEEPAGMLLFPAGTDPAAAEEAAAAVLEKTPEGAYALASIEYAAADYGDCVELAVDFIYQARSRALSEFRTVHSQLEAVDALMAEWEAGEETAYYRLDDVEITEKALELVFLTAQENDADRIANAFYMSFDFYPALQPDCIVKTNANRVVYAEDAAPYEAELREAADAASAEIRETAGEGAGDEALCRAAFDYLCAQAEYDDILAAKWDENEEEDWVRRSAHGALVDGETVCSGYAYAFRLLCDRLGIPCWVVVGNVQDGGHAWNLVNLESGTYWVDVTFGDTGGGEDYCLFGASLFEAEGYSVYEGYLLPWALPAA